VTLSGGRFASLGIYIVYTILILLFDMYYSLEYLHSLEELLLVPLVLSPSYTPVSDCVTVS
jgi:hypothetical protein